MPHPRSSLTLENAITAARKARIVIETVRHLRPGQVVAQTLVRLKRQFENPARLLSRAVPPFPGCRWNPHVGFLPPGLQDNRSADILQGRLTFVGLVHQVGWPPAWASSGIPKLWQYNLHYFEYLWALDFKDAKALVSDWIQHHVVGKGRTGWEPYPTSLRLINWCCYFFSRHRSATEQDVEFIETLWTSIYRQTAWLYSHLEWHLLGNHLLENVAALSLVAHCFQEQVSATWRGKVMRILKDQLGEQILPDGGHFERSPMYQSRVVFLLATLANIGDARLTTRVQDPLERLLAGLVKLCHPDGQIALLNDSALNIYNQPAELVDFWRRITSGSLQDVGWAPAGPFTLPQTGYYGHRTRNSSIDLSGDSFIVCDAGPLGPDYLPGHAHGDIFSFELSLKGRRVIVDSGVCGYQEDPMRAYCRSTPAHNTVSIDESDQAEFWGAFRVARRGHPRDVQWNARDDGFNLSGGHTGFNRLPGKPRHHRTFAWYAPSTLLVRDVVEFTGGPHAVSSRLHLHPDCRVEKRGDDVARITLAGDECTICFTGDGQTSIEESFYCPGFGAPIRNQVLTFKGTAEVPSWQSAFCVAGGTPEIMLSMERGATVDGRWFSFQGAG